MSYKANVACAARTLDRLVPGWHKKMNLSKLKMDNTSLCALGQLFGHDVEMSIAKELYPEEHAALANRVGLRTGFDIGLRWIGEKLTGKTYWPTASSESEEMRFLVGACGGSPSLKCHWAEEVADRLVTDVEESR